MSIFLYRRGKGAKRRVMHMPAYNRAGQIVSALCGRMDFDTSCNLPLGQRICKDCLKRQQEYTK